LTGRLSGTETARRKKEGGRENKKKKGAYRNRGRKKARARWLSIVGRHARGAKKQN